jgi:hypothetical protein
MDKRRIANDDKVRHDTEVRKCNIENQSLKLS